MILDTGTRLKHDECSARREREKGKRRRWRKAAGISNCAHSRLEMVAAESERSFCSKSYYTPLVWWKILIWIVSIQSDRFKWPVISSLAILNISNLSQGKVCPNMDCDGVLEIQACRGHCGYPVTHYWRHVPNHGIFFQVKKINYSFGLI